MSVAAKFQKKPVVIEATVFDGTWASAKAILDWMEPDRPIDRSQNRWSDMPGVGGRMHINTLEGEMIASPGDWIIKGVKGEFYPCRGDIFNASYECYEPPADTRPGASGSEAQG